MNSALKVLIQALSEAAAVGPERIVCHARKKGVVELKTAWIFCSTTVSSEVCRSKLIWLKVVSPRTISAILVVGSGLISKIVCFQ